MSGVAIEIQLEDAGAGAALRALRELGANLRPVMDDIGAELESSTLDRFETNIAPDGSAWPQSLASKLTGKPTLVRNAYLRDSVHYRLDGDSAVEIGAGGIAADYAAIHQTGGVITAKGEALNFTLASGAFVQVQSVTIPARPYLGLSDADRLAIGDIVGDHLARAAASGAA
ncbi:MAG: phage virion morphogenesis protein [Phenylobacterium sp.]|uniref:phage virion morphogenesis protein n=1 Tax=Phenylobacterium sp. TaxID=1871053 RepID=UPI0017F32E49|nr:phage virion morphogenesis protein [Phenylobacterium sp.]MBA4792290.1 phage virion morphogenesis protein [Phenylobacterium sp.]